ncbi:diguanylate cyclase [Stieleria marina]|uniref:diguanylate cyclase n=1 Tax=Stieleria marina TaxID=1930275 RepID=A0A517NX27_9BACT|nr:Diguanylate cyclase DosC [Planctomycetes bacterium K23_9]
MHDCLNKVLNNAAVPSPPTVAAEILDLVAQSESTIDQITQVISSDPNLSGRLIAYCNSPIVGCKRTIGSLPQAVVVLGLRKLRLIALSFSLLETKDENGFDYEQFWRRSLATAIASQLVGERSNGSSQESFLQGLVLNVGQIGLANTFSKLYSDLDTDENGTVCTVDESEMFGIHRYGVGAEMLQKWHFPEHMVDAVGQYDPLILNHRTKPFQLAERLALLLTSDNIAVHQIDETKRVAEAWLGIDSIAFAEIFEQMLEHWKSFEKLFQFDSIPFDSLGEMESIAKQRLIDMAMGMDSEVEVLRQEYQDLKRSSLVDVLTRLKNREAYEFEVPGVVDYHRRQKKSFGILVIDIDHFKSINDTYGHAGGDAVLKAVGECLIQNCRKYDTVYRYGGEEFVAMIVDCVQFSTERIADRFRAAIEALRIPFESEMLKITASIGICWTEHGETESLDKLFQIADSNLYHAKHSGRNCCVVRPESPGVSIPVS